LVVQVQFDEGIAPLRLDLSANVVTSTVELLRGDDGGALTKVRPPHPNPLQALTYVHAGGIAIASSFDLTEPYAV
jgi:hypothetical protein